MLKLMCLFIPSFFCILTEYIKNKITERKEKECHCCGEHSGMPQGMEGMY